MIRFLFLFCFCVFYEFNVFADDITQCAKYLGDRDEVNALKCANSMIASSPNNDLMYVYRGTVYSSFNQPWNAIKDFSKAISINKDNLSSFSLRGIVYNMLEEYQLALNDFEHVISYSISQNNVQFISVLIQAAFIEKKLKKFNKAIMKCEKSLTLLNKIKQNNSLNIFDTLIKESHLCICEGRIALKEFNLAFKSCELLYQDDVTNYIYMINFASVYIEQSEFNKAIDILDKSLDKFKNDFLINYNLTLAYKKKYEKSKLEEDKFQWRKHYLILKKLSKTKENNKLLHNVEYEN